MILLVKGRCFGTCLRKLIVQVSVVLRKTVGWSDWHFDSLSSGHLGRCFGLDSVKNTSINSLWSISDFFNSKDSKYLAICKPQGQHHWPTRSWNIFTRLICFTSDKILLYQSVRCELLIHTLDKSCEHHGWTMSKKIGNRPNFKQFASGFVKCDSPSLRGFVWLMLYKMYCVSKVKYI